MPSERESNEVKKSMAYDLHKMIEAAPEKESYTAQEVKDMIDEYIRISTGK